MAFIGNYVGQFSCGDIFFIGSNVPHTFRKQTKNLIASAVVVQFTDDFWGKDFLNIPENNEVRELFTTSMKGLQLEGETKFALVELIKELENAKGFSRITILCNCLKLIVEERSKTTLSTRQMSLLNDKYKQRIDTVFQYTIANFREPITLPQIASKANMSVTAFCAYFKKSTKKSYIEFVNEVRISYACKLLQDTDKSVINVCYESGFNTAVNFNKQFLKVKKITPSQYRNRFLNGVQ